MADITNLADLIARMKLYGLSNPDTGPTPEDPQNWINIQSQLQGVGSSPEEYAGLQQAAQQAIMSQGGYMPQTVDPNLALTDPAAADAALRQNMVNQLMQMLQGQQGAYDAASAQVGQQYQDLTNPINQEGTGFLQDLYSKLGIDPATDPTAQGFMNTLSQGQNTAQLNQATDQAWFDKMKVNNQISTQGLIQGISDGSIPLPGAVSAGSGGGGGGGGGHGGGGRRGYGGGGSGSGGNGWKNPSTSDALTQAAAVDTTFQYPGFREDFIGAGASPEEAETLRRLAAQAGGLPYNVNKLISGTELPNTEAAIDALTAQQAQRAAYTTVLGQGGRYADTQNRQTELQNKAAAVNEQGVPKSPLTMPEQQQLEATRTVTTPLSRAPIQEAIAKFMAGMTLGNPKKAGQDFQLRQGNPWEQAYNAQQDLDKEQLRLAQSNPTDVNPTGQGKDFTFKDWPGYVPNVDQQDISEKQSYLDLLLRGAAVAEEYDPNAGWQETKYTGKDSTATKTSQTSKDPANQLFNNNTDPGYVPYSQDTTSPDDAALGLGGGGFGMGANFTDAAKRIVANRMKKDKALKEQQDQPTMVDFVAQAMQGPKAKAKPIAKVPKKTTAPKPTNVVEAIQQMGANIMGPKKPAAKPVTLSKAMQKAAKKTIKNFF